MRLIPYFAAAAAILAVGMVDAQFFSSGFNGFFRSMNSGFRTMFHPVMNMFSPPSRPFGPPKHNEHSSSGGGGFGGNSGTDKPQATGKDETYPTDCGRDKKKGTGLLCFPDGELCKNSKRTRSSSVLNSFINFVQNEKTSFAFFRGSGIPFHRFAAANLTPAPPASAAHFITLRTRTALANRCCIHRILCVCVSAFVRPRQGGTYWHLRPNRGSASCTLLRRRRNPDSGF